MKFDEIYSELAKTNGVESTDRIESTFEFTCGWIRTRISLVVDRELIQIYTLTKARKTDQLTSLMNIPFEKVKSIAIASGCIRFMTDCNGVEGVVFFN